MTLTDQLDLPSPTAEPPLPEPAANLLLLCTLDELPIGLGRAFHVADTTIAVFRTRKGKLFATQNNCPHKNGPLAEGMLAGDAIVCPLHAFKYDLHSGTCDQENACSIKTFPLQLQNNQVILHLPDLTQ